uniref:EF-hand domain-containing protein n=1 Tax=Biomphalaria glabrata TaxID=6526 RepID=A0A2C9KUP1_BIOGL
MATSVMGFTPDNQIIQFTARPALRTRESVVSVPHSLIRSGHSSSMESIGLLPRQNGENSPLISHANMSSIEIESLVREKVRNKYDKLKQGFKLYDVDNNETVTKGEFRRVLEMYCMPLTADQFDSILAKIGTYKAGTTVNYSDFLNKFSGIETAGKNWSARMDIQGPKEVNMDILEKLLRDKINSNLRSVIKGLQMFDFNMDGKIQRHELRRVLDTHCFKFTDQQFEKLWLRYDFHHTGLVNYREFLERLGINVKRSSTTPPSNTVAGVLKWPTLNTGQAKQRNGVAGQRKNQQKEDEKLVQSLTFDQIEIEFRNRMRKNYMQLKKAFMTFDKHLDGYVSIEDLKSILHNFTLPLSDQLFIQLMERCGVRASGRVAWELFLEKFQNPVNIGNGQTLPIRSNYRIHPIMEIQKVVDWDTIWTQLYKRVQSHYNSLKEAFLQIDKNRDGRVTKKEFRELIERFTFRLDDKQFKELMLHIDPDQRNNVDYQTFLRLFEEKETKEGHKWLKSVHKYNNKPKPAIMAWEAVEDLLREKITFYWKDFSDWLSYHDRSGQGYMSKSTLKKILDMQVLPISDEHFENLINRCSDFKDGKVNYMEFLTRLGVDISPGDVTGVSAQITDGSNLAELKRNMDQINRNNKIACSQSQRSSLMTADEVIVRFKDKIAQWSPELRKAFVACDQKNKGYITKKAFRKVLADLGILMADDQFAQLMSKLNIHNGHMQYIDFIMNFGDPRHPDASPGITPHVSNHRVNAIRGDEHSMTVEEVEIKLRQKLRENFTNLREAFYKFDDLSKGCLDRASFRTMLDSFMIYTNDDIYEQLCDKLGIAKGTRISYLEFLERFELRDLPEGHKWLNSVHRYNETLTPRAILAPEAYSMLTQKIFRQWKDLSQAFRALDCKNNGIITKQELKESLHKFLIPIHPQEFKKLWTRLDAENKGFISHEDFLQRLVGSEFAPGDNQGPSADIIKGNYHYMKDHSRKQQEKHEAITWNQVNLTKTMPAIMVERVLRDKIRDSYNDCYTAFQKYDTRKCGFLSANDIQKVLMEQNLFINDDQFFALLDRIGLSTSQSQINYADFLKAFEDGRKSSYGTQPQDIRIEEYNKLNPEDAEKKFKQKLQANAEDVLKALAAFDKDDNGKITLDDLRRVLDLFCFIMTDAQWKHIKKGFNVSTDQMVDYNDWLSGIVHIDNQYLQSLQNMLPLQYNTFMLMDEVAERIHEAVVAHYHNILRDFENVDFAKIGSVTADDLREIIARHILRFNDEQFERILKISPLNEFGNVDYKQFMKIFFEGVPPASLINPVISGNNSTELKSLDQVRPMTSLSQRPFSRASSRPLSRLTRSTSRCSSRAMTPMINAESAEELVKEAVYRHWRTIQKSCRDIDYDNTGTVTSTQFENILTQLGVVLSPSNLKDLITKYDINENGRFAYNNFIRHFLLTVKSSESGRTTRKDKKASELTNCLTIQEENESDVMRRILECVHFKWKDMRREFRNIDQKSEGKVSTEDFRKVLRLFNINLSEYEFQQLQEQYDKNFTDFISYNEFLKNYLQYQ